MSKMLEVGADRESWKRQCLKRRLHEGTLPSGGPQRMTDVLTRASLCKAASTMTWWAAALPRGTAISWKGPQQKLNKRHCPFPVLSYQLGHTGEKELGKRRKGMKRDHSLFLQLQRPGSEPFVSAELGGRRRAGVRDQFHLCNN